MKIVTQTENKLLHRNEIVAEHEFDGATPSNADVKSAIAKAAKADEKMTVVKNIDVKYGTHTATVTAYVYSNKDTMHYIERIKEEPKAETPAEEAKE